MARSYKMPSHQLKTAQSLAASFKTAPTNVQNYDRVLYNFIWSSGSSLDGSLEVQYSNDHDGIEANADNANWYALDFGSAPQLSGAAGSHQMLIDLVTFKYVRLVFTRVAGTGNADVFIGMSAVGV